MEKEKLQKGSCALATNGIGYEVINSEKGLVKRIDHIDLDKFIHATDYLSEKEEVHNTKTLYKYLKPKLEGVIYSKKGFVEWKGFKVKFENFGYRISDKLNFGKVVNINEYYNDFSYPDDVLEWLSKNADRKVVTKKLTVEERERAELVGELTKKFRVKAEDLVKEPSIKERKDVLEEREKNKKEAIDKSRKTRIENAISELNESVKNKEKIEALKSKLKYISVKKSFWEPAIKLVYKVVKKKIRRDKFIREITKLANELRTEKTEQPKRVKFEGIPDLYVPRNPIFKNLNIEFDQKDEFSAKARRLVMPTTEYLGSVVLYHFPKAMPMLMKVAKGEFDIETIKDFKYVKDPFEEYNIELMRNPKDREKFMFACKQILEWKDIDTAVDIEYKPSESLSKGDRVRVYWPDNKAWYYGNIVSKETGIKILYDDGEILYLLKHQNICVVNKNS